MTVQLRKAMLQDVETVVQILHASRCEYLPYARSPHSLDEHRQWVRGQLIPNYDVMLAIVNNETVGVLALSVAENHGWIDQLFLAPGYVRRGIGTELLAYALAVLPRPIRLWTFQQNERAIRFYEYHGFQAIRYTNGDGNEEKCPDILYELV